MARSKKQRIDTNATQDLGFAAFASLDAKTLGDLPDGPEKVAPPTSAADPKASETKPAATKRQRLVLRKETAHRGGKAVIVVDGFPLHASDDEIVGIAAGLRRACGSGGTVKERTIEIQGNQAARIRTFLEQAGYQVDGVK